MRMTMVQVWRVGVIVLEPLVAVPVTVRACRHGIMHVAMVPVVVAMGMFVLQSVVRMQVAMAFGSVEINADQHQYRRAA